MSLSLSVSCACRIAGRANRAAAQSGSARLNIFIIDHPFLEAMDRPWGSLCQGFSRDAARGNEPSRAEPCRTATRVGAVDSTAHPATDSFAWPLVGDKQGVAPN